jgi:hypothetical protein
LGEQVAQPIGVVSEEDFVITYKLAHAGALADVCVLTCVDKSDPPIFDVLAQSSIFFPPREDKVVRNPLWLERLP